MNEKQIKDGELYEARFGFKERNSSFRFLVILLALFLALMGARTYWITHYGGVVVDGSSMNVTLTDGDSLLIRYVQKTGQAKRGDVIVVYVGDYEECKSVQSGFLIKRLIAVEGDSLYCTDGQIYIRYAGEDEYTPLAEPYAYYGVNDAYKTQYDFDEYAVGEGEIFFLGDNRSRNGSSVDSRYKQYPNGSHLADRLYKAENIYGIVPDWAIENRRILEKIFFGF